MAHNRIVEHLWIPLPDGRRLAARLWLPASETPAPVILEYLPYRKRDGTASRDETTHTVFSDAGYACIRVDIAGTGESDGIFDDEYSEQELGDGEDVIRWTAEQTWSDGNVGIIGISWGGFNGLQLAFRRPPALKAVVTVCSTVDRYADDIHYMGGCLLTDNFNWGAQMTAYQTRPPDPALRDDWYARWMEQIDTLPFLAADWLRQSPRGAYWKHGSVCEDWNAIEAATLAIGGWADAYVNAPPALAENLAAPAKALVGAWDHKYPHIARVNPADFHGEVIAWFDRWLRNEDNGTDALPAMRAFIQEHDHPSPKLKPRAGRWVAEQVWPSPDISTRTLYPSGNRLENAPGKGETVVSTPFHIGAGAAYFCPGMRIDNELSDDQAEDDALSACFDTAPLDAPLEILGRPELEIAFTVDRPVAQICARICDVAPDGVSQRVTYRAFNLCHHASHEEPEPLVPGKRYTARIPLNACGHRFAEGHRVRLALSTSYWPVVWPAPAPVSVTLALSQCRLDLPVRAVAIEPDPKAPGQPRPFPSANEEILREPVSRSDRTVEPDGRHVFSTFDDFGTTRDLGHGLENGSSVAQTFAIHPDDPLTAVHECEWNFTFHREGWDAAIRSISRMSCSGEAFHLTRRVIATHDGETVVDRTWEATIDRDLL